MFKRSRIFHRDPLPVPSAASIANDIALRKGVSEKQMVAIQKLANIAAGCIARRIQHDVNDQGNPNKTGTSDSGNPFSYGPITLWFNYVAGYAEVPSDTRGYMEEALRGELEKLGYTLNDFTENCYAGDTEYRSSINVGYGAGNYHKVVVGMPALEPAHSDFEQHMDS